jgi:hypothetical protein
MYSQPMRRWLVWAMMLEVILFFGGWALVDASDYGGNRIGGSSVVWDVGGLMVYASMVILPPIGFVLIVRYVRGRHQSALRPGA